jgi:AcrR family transcriptional regulator
MMAANTRRPGGRSARKHRAIFKAARTTFLAKGYDDTSMDAIAALAGVSKPTIYKHFGDKDGLFRATIAAEIAEAESHTQAMLDALPATRNLERDLRRFARQHLTDVMQPHLVRMRRRLIAEAERFPQLAASWYRSGPEKGHETLAAIFSALAARQLLRIDDALVAAEQFNWLVLIPLNRAMFITRPVRSRDLHRAADRAVATFLAAYRSQEPERRQVGARSAGNRGLLD